MRRVMIFLPPKSTPTPSPSPSPAPLPFMESEFVPFTFNPTEGSFPYKFAFYVIKGTDKPLDIVCLEVSPEIKCVGGPYSTYDEAEKAQEFLTSNMPTP